MKRSLLLLAACTGCGSAGWDTASFGDVWLAMRVDGEDVVFEGASGQGVSSGLDSWEEWRVVSQSFTFVDPSGPAIEIESVAHFADTDYPDDDQLESIFGVGEHPWGTLTNNSEDDTVEVAGVNLKYFDANGAEWIASITVGDESDAHFDVTSHEPLDDTSSWIPALYLTEGTFTCTLYGEDGSTMAIEDGVFRAETTVAF